MTIINYTEFFKRTTFFALLFTGMMTITQAQIITTIAGNGSAGHTGDGGQATSAELNNPFNMCLDNNGNMFIGDQSNNVVRQLNLTTGVITTVAGNGTAGFSGDGFAATDAQLSNSCGVAVDSFGNLFIADQSNNRIRKVVLSTGIITTIAGNGGQGFAGDGGQATNANFSAPLGIAVDDSGNVYVADHYNERVRKITVSTGIVTTLAGDGSISFKGDGGQGTAAGLYYPEGVAVDDSGNVYVADQWNNRVRKINQTTGIITSVAGNGVIGSSGTGSFSGDGGPATNAGIDIISSVALDASGNMYIADTRNNLIRKVVKSTGIITTFAGTTAYLGTWNGGFSGDGGPATDAAIDQPYGVVVDKCGNVYITDETNQRIRKVSLVDSITVSEALPSICSGGNDTLTVSGASNYSWTPSLGLSDSTSSVVIASPSVTTTYTVVGISTCYGATPSKTLVVNVTQAPPFDIEPQSPTICYGSNVKLYVVGGGTNFVWSPSSSLNPSTGDTVFANPTINVTYTVTGTNSGGCVSSGTNDVSVVPAPNKPTISKSADGDTLISSATQGNQWYVNDTLIIGATNQTLDITGQKTGSYTVEVINPANGCSATSDPLVASAINQLSAINNQVSIYPNPASGKFVLTISSSAGDIRDWKLEVDDVLGRTLNSRASLSYSNEIDLTEFSAGVYFVSVSAKTERTVFMLIKR